MSKIDEYDFKKMPQEVVDFKDQVRELLNFGKYQAQLLTGIPAYIGRGGEQAWYVGADSGALYVNLSDGTSTWTKVIEFPL